MPWKDVSSTQWSNCWLVFLFSPGTVADLAVGVSLFCWYSMMAGAPPRSPLLIFSVSSLKLDPNGPTYRWPEQFIWRSCQGDYFSIKSFLIWAISPSKLKGSKCSYVKTYNTKTMSSFVLRINGSDHPYVGPFLRNTLRMQGKANRKEPFQYDEVVDIFAATMPFVTLSLDWVPSASSVMENLLIYFRRKFSTSFSFPFHISFLV